MRLLWNVLAGGLLGISIGGCRSVDHKLEKRVDAIVAKIEQKQMFSRHMLDDVVDGQKVKAAVEKNLPGLLASTEWKNVLFYCGSHDIPFAHAAREAVKNQNAKLYRGDGGLPEFVEKCLWENDHFLDDKETRAAVFGALENCSEKMQSPYEIVLLQRVLDEYPAEKEACLKNVVRSLARLKSYEGLSRAAKLAVDLPMFLEKAEYELLAGVNLVDIDVDQFVRHPQYNDVLIALDLCKKIDPELKGVNEVVLEKMLPVLDHNNAWGVSVPWVYKKYQEKGLSSSEAVRRAVLFFSDAMVNGDFFEKLWVNKDLFPKIPTQREKEAWLVQYAKEGVRKLSDVFALAVQIEHDDTLRLFFNQSFHTFIKKATEESFAEALYLALHYPTLKEKGEYEFLADRFISARFFFHPDDGQPDVIIEPSFEDIRRGMTLLKAVSPELENMTQERLKKVLQALKKSVQTIDEVVKACDEFGMPQKETVVDEIVKFFGERPSGALLTSLDKYQFVPSKKVAQEYCAAILDSGEGSIEDVFLWLDKYSADPFSGRHYVHYAVQVLSKKGLKSQNVRDAAWALEHGVALKNASRPSDAAFDKDVQNLLTNPVIDSHEIICLYAVLGKKFGAQEYHARLKVFDEKQKYMQLSERIKLFGKVMPSLSQKDDDFKYAMVNDVFKSMNQLQEWELMLCIRELQQSKNAERYVRLAGDLMIESGRLNPGEHAWRLCKYQDGITELEMKSKRVQKE